MSNDYLNLAKQDSPETDRTSTEPGLSNPVYDDSELVRRAQKDDAWAIEKLVIRYQEKVYAIAYQMLSGDAEAAKDQTQETFFRAFRKIKQFKGKSSFYTWLYRIVINTCLDARRRRRRWKEVFFSWRSAKNSEDSQSVSLEEFPDRDRNSDPSANINGQALRNDLDRAMNKLSERQRAIFQLKIFHEMSIPEISKTIGIAQGTVKTHLFRATQVIQKQLKEWSLE